MCHIWTLRGNNMEIIKTYISITLFFLFGVISAQDSISMSFAPAGMEKVIVFATYR